MVQIIELSDKNHEIYNNYAILQPILMWRYFFN